MKGNTTVLLNGGWGGVSSSRLPESGSCLPSPLALHGPRDSLLHRVFHLSILKKEKKAFHFEIIIDSQEIAKTSRGPGSPQP
jgi:hypothetical protein